MKTLIIFWRRLHIGFKNLSAGVILGTIGYYLWMTGYSFVQYIAIYFILLGATIGARSITMVGQLLNKIEHKDTDKRAIITVDFSLTNDKGICGREQMSHKMCFVDREYAHVQSQSPNLNETWVCAINKIKPTYYIVEPLYIDK